jgi:NADH dehydrogenase
MLAIVRRRRLLLNVPVFAAKIMAFAFGLGQTLSLGIIKAPVTKDQVINLAIDNVVSEDAQGFDALGIRPIAMATVLPDYLWRFRPSGQYDAIKESAKNLRT